MRKQRNTFFGERPEKSPRKHGPNPPVPDRRIDRLSPDEIAIRFTDTTATAVGGYPLLDQFCRELRVSERLARHIKISRGQGFTAPELSRFFIDTRILGAERLSHVDELRRDPMLVQSYGIDGLPSDETLGRYFKSYAPCHIVSFERMTNDVDHRCWRQGAKKEIEGLAGDWVILDYDTSTMTVYGAQEGADRGRSFRKKDNPGFQPKFCFVGGLGLMLHQRLYAESVNLPTHFEAFHAESVAKLPPGVRPWAIRGDAALYSGERIERFEAEGLVYGISAAKTPDLKARIAAIPEADWGDYEDEDGRAWLARITYRPKTWEREHTYVISRRLKEPTNQRALWEGEQYRYFAYVTNVEGDVFEQYRFCVERCSLENFIKEGKLGFHFDKLPHAELDANRAYLAHVQLAYNLTIWWKLLKSAPEVSRWTVDTLRRRVLRICGNLRRRAGRWVLTLPAWWPWRWVYRDLAVAAGLSPP